LRLAGGLDALAQYVFIGIEHSMEHGLARVAQASEYVTGQVPEFVVM
jgi:hypothetical protein